MSDNPRSRRLANRIRQIVATMLDTRVKDPRLGTVTITDVRVTGDLQHATVFYTVFGSDEEREGTAAALRSATGLLRSEVGKQTGVRLTPSLEFVLDAIPENARAIDDLLVMARHRDAELARTKEGASFAGEADPYRVPHDEHVEDDDLDDDYDLDGDRDDAESPDGAGEDASPEAADEDPRA
ncbi:30S ribosome-binding factor RbfA [Brachybacterium sp. DNPG3]